MVSLGATDGLASKLRSLDCEPLCVENLVWSLPAGDNDDRWRTELPKLSRINSVRHNRRVQRMFQRRSATDGFQRGRPRTVIHSVCKGQLTNRFFLKDRRSLSDQISFILSSNRRAFILAMRDRDRANKNEIEIFVFTVTSNDFPHDMLTLAYRLKNMVP